MSEYYHTSNLSEDFPEEEIDYNATFDFAGWTNFAETGTKLWIERDFDNDGYVDATFLNIKAQYVHVWDSCHSRENKGVVTYQLKK